MSINTMDAEVARLLEAGKNSARNGDTAAARSYLTQVVERDPHNEQAWMWLSGVTTEPEEQQICLENVLVINPYNTKARQGLEFLSTRTGIPTQAPPVPSEYTSPLSDLNIQGVIQSPFGSETAPAVGFNMTAPPAQPQALPDFSGEFALPPWMENGAAPDPLAGAGAGTSLAYDMFASSPGAPEPAQADPWAGLGVSSDSLNIDWSRGMEPEPAPPANGGYHQPYSSADHVSVSDAATWSMDDMPGFQPLEPGSLGFGQAGASAFPHMEQSYPEPDVADWQNGHSNAGSAGSYGPMGPAGDFQLPTPSDLPGFDMSPQGEAKPWYAQSTQLSPGMMGDPATANGFTPENPDERTQHLSSPKKDQVMVTCPHCAEKVPDTSLSCTRCGFSFFVNCPHCHELLDVIDAKAEVAEPCPHCGKSIEKMQLGMTSADPTNSYVSARPVKPDAVAPEMRHYIREATRRRGGFTWSWVVDVMWLVAIVMMVWVLTQLPAWWHLTGQY